MRRLSGIFLPAALLLFLAPLPAAAGSLYSRDLVCQQQPSDRAKKICRALERELEWTWKGHAIISPSYRMTIDGERRVFCQLPITVKDVIVLVNMALDSVFGDNMSQAQIDNGSRSLLKLLGQQAIDRFPSTDNIPDKTRRLSAEYLKKEIQMSISSPSNIFNPSHPNYILRDGCPQ